MRSVVGVAMWWVAVVCQQSVAEPTWPADSPWRAEADKLPALPHGIEMTLAIDQSKIVTFESVIARVTLRNNDRNPLTLEVRDDGAPYLLASLVAFGDEPFVRLGQWLRTSGPKRHKITLAPGESTAGDILILFGGPPTGFPFAEPGRYWVKFACQVDGHYAPRYTNEVQIRVSRDERGNAGFLDELSEIAYAHYGWDRESVVRNNGEEYLIGIRLLEKLIKVQKPHLVDPARRPEDKKEAELVEQFRDLLARYPESSYSGYLARYLGLVDLKTFEHELSLEEGKIWKETGKAPQWDPPTFRAHPAYQRALGYLTRADNSNLWPQTCALFNLGWLHLASHEWDKAQACCTKLRTKYSELDGLRQAAEISSTMEKYKAKLERRREKVLPTNGR